MIFYIFESEAIIMKNSKQLQVVFLTVALLLTACGGGTASDTTAADGSNALDTTEALTGRDAVRSTLPDDLDFGGETLTVLQRSSDEYIGEFVAEEENGDILNDIIYLRNRSVEEQMNISMEVTSIPGDGTDAGVFINTVRGEVMSGGTSYDVISFYAYENPRIIQESMYLNLHDVEHINLAQPWWHQMYIECASVYGKLYAVTGDIVLSSVSRRKAMFYNSTMGESYLEDMNLVELVDSGKWTMDTFGSLVKDVYQDLNGNAQKDTADLYGWYPQKYAHENYVIGCGLTYTEKTADGGYKLALENERNVKIIELFNQLASEPGVFLSNEYDKNVFIEGRCLFFPERIGFTDELRDMEDDYAIIPLPKFDESQEAYYSSVGDSYSQVGIPVTAKNPAMSGAFLEAAAEYNYKKLTPAYFDIVLEGKYLRDPDSARMIDLVIEGAWYDFAVVNTAVLGNMSMSINNTLTTGNFASTIAANKTTYETKLSELLAFYKDAE